MAISPFDAFAEWRLNAEALDEPQIGLSPMDRGNLVHSILEAAWARIKDSQTLAKLDRTELSKLCQQFAQAELRKYLHQFGQRFLTMEAERLAGLVTDWLEFEKDRPSFKVELAEENLEANIGGLSFALRLDRLDRLENGSHLLIDYKTGASLSRSYWLELPPEEPQLPLYALTLGNAPDALCFAKVRSEKLEFIGIGREELFSGIQARDDWASLLESWRTELEALAQAYIAGEARVFETGVVFGQTDPLAPLHRFAEKEQLEAHKDRLNRVPS